MAHGKSPTHTRKPRKKAAAKTRAAAASPKAGPTSKEDPGSNAAAPGQDGRFDGRVRLQKLLASAGFGSRRVVERFLTEERVTVNGRVAQLGDRADPSVDDIRLDGERLLKDKPSYWILNKPRGVVTTVRDDEGRRTVMDLLPPSVGRVFPVGRLDRETTGLLLMTNDGDTAHALLHPSHGNEREYRVIVKGALDARASDRLAKGVSLEEGRTAPARISGARFDQDTNTTTFSLTLVEGKKRQIRRSLLVLGFPVRRLSRVRMGPLTLGRLPVGEARMLRPEERRALLAHAAKLREGTDGKSGARSKKSAGRSPKPRTARAEPASKPAAKSSPRPTARKKPAVRSQRAASSRKGIKR